MGTWVVIAAYNEAAMIGTVVSRLVAGGWKQIAVVDDGSRDATATNAAAAGATVLPNIGVGTGFDNRDNPGYAVGRTGHAQFSWIASLGVIEQSGEHLLMLINDLLDFARIGAGKLELEVGDVPLSPSVPALPVTNRCCGTSGCWLLLRWSATIDIA